MSVIEQVETGEVLVNYRGAIHVNRLSGEEKFRKFCNILTDAKAAYIYFLVKTKRNLDPICVTYFEHLHYHLLSIAGQDPTLQRLVLGHFPIEQGARIFNLS